MARTPGFVIPPEDPAQQEEFEEELRRRGEVAGYTPLAGLSHSDEDPFVKQAEAAEDFLRHYGVKGMKWGQGKRSAAKAAAKSPASEDAQRVGQIHAKVKVNKSTKPLSNKELQDAITRMNLEQQYSRMTGGLDKSRRQKASNFIHELVTGMAKDTISSIAKDQLKVQVEQQTKTGRYDPVAVAKREADLASANARTRQANAS